MVKFFQKLKYVDKIHVEYKVNLLMKTNTINKEEIEKFSRIAEEWWDPTGKFKPLHKFNPIRSHILKIILSIPSNLKIKISHLKILKF